MPLSAGTWLGRFEILSQIGKGGMGEVYRARDPHLGREVALKVLPTHRALDRQARQRFEREARAVAAISHPNILELYDFGEEQGVYFAVMELLRGETLRRRLGGRALEWREAVRIAAAVADGLAATHAAGIVHRDLKPENIFLTADDRVKILDFGLARMKPPAPGPGAASGVSTAALTPQGLVMGTVGYMSPEQVRGEEAAAPSDIFSFGCVLYEMLGGRPAFIRATAADTKAAILHEEPPGLLSLCPQAPEKLVGIVDRCLKKNSAERFHSAHDLAAGLQDLLSTPDARKTAAEASATRPRRAPLWAVLLALSLAAAAYLTLPRDWWRVLGTPTGDGVGGRRGAVKAENSLAVLVTAGDSGALNVKRVGEEFADGLIRRLSNLPQLKVIGWTTSRVYAEKQAGKRSDPRRASRELGVKYLLLVDVVGRDRTSEIQVELVEGESRFHLWGGKFPLSTPQPAESEVARQVSEKLSLELTGEQQRQVSARHTQSAAAEELYAKGRWFANQRTEEGINKAIECYRQALKADPNFALAYASLAEAFVLSAGPPADSLLNAKEAALKALEIDSRLVEASTSLAAVKLLHDWDWDEAQRAFERARGLTPNHVTTHQWYAEYLTAMGKHAEALAAIQQAQELDHLSLPVRRDAAWHYYCARQYDEAVKHGREAIDLDPHYAPARAVLGLAYVEKGMFGEAIDELQKAVALSASGNLKARLGYAYASAGRRADAQAVLAELRGATVSPVLVAAIEAALGDEEQALASLDQAFRERSALLIYLKVLPLLDKLRPTAGFERLKLRVGLPG